MVHSKPQREPQTAGALCCVLLSKILKAKIKKCPAAAPTAALMIPQESQRGLGELRRRKASRSVRDGAGRCGGSSLGEPASFHH